MTGDGFLGVVWGARGLDRVGGALDSRSIIQAEGREGSRREIRT